MILTLIKNILIILVLIENSIYSLHLMIYLLNKITSLDLKNQVIQQMFNNFQLKKLKILMLDLL